MQVVFIRSIAAFFAGWFCWACFVFKEMIKLIILNILLGFWKTKISKAAFKIMLQIKKKPINQITPQTNKTTITPKNPQTKNQTNSKKPSLNYKTKENIFQTDMEYTEKIQNKPQAIQFVMI